MSQMPSAPPQPHWTGTEWVWPGHPQYPQAAAAPPPPPPAPPAPPQYAPPAGPPPAPAYGLPPGGPPPPPAAPQGPIPAAPAYAPAPQQGYAPQGAVIDFGAIAWSGGVPEGTNYLIRIEDIEAGVSGAGNDKIQVTGTTTQANGAVAAGYKCVWSYALTDAAIGKLGKDMIALGVTSAPKDPRALAAALLQQLRGVVIIADSKIRSGRDTADLTIKGRYTGGSAQATTPPPAPAPVGPPQPPAPPQAPPPPPQGYAVSFPQPGGPGFNAV